MILSYDKIKLRAIELSDAEFLRDMINSKDIENNVLGWSFPISSHQQLRWIEQSSLEKNNIRFIIEYDDSPVGMASITHIDFKNSNASINIKLHDSAPKRIGIGTIVISLLINYSFEELNLHCLIANILENNIPSQKLYEKVGFVGEGILRERVYKGGRYHNVLSYSILRKKEDD